MKFNYTARTAAGEIQAGDIEAKNKDQAIEILQKHGLIIFSLKEKEVPLFFLREIKFFPTVAPKDLVIFSRQLAVLFSCRIPLMESVRVTAKQTINLYFQDILSKVANDIEAGVVLSKALEKYPKIFSSFFINMVKSGEISGTLENVLNYLADYLEKEYYLSSRVKGAMVYPAFVLACFIIVAILMLVMVIPNLTSILKETGQALPWTTRLIIGASDGIRNFGWLIGSIFIFLIGGAVHYVRNYPDGRKIWDATKLKTPVMGLVFQKFYLSHLSDTLGTLIASGVPILQALQISAEVMDNVVLKEIILEARKEVRIGNTMSSVFGRYNEIPPMVTNMLAVGEQTGTIDMVLKKLSNFYSKEVDNTVSTLTQLIEPVLIVVLGIGVAILVASVLMPIYNMAGGL